jgi:hypothetical protein
MYRLASPTAQEQKGGDVRRTDHQQDEPVAKATNQQKRRRN